LPDPHEFYHRVATLERERRRFAVATVVARRPPVSARLGDRAIVFPDGHMEGFVGGACSREIIRQQALAALTARAARLVSIRPDPSESAEPGADRIVVHMTCASEGAVDVLVEPIVRPPSIIVVGATPVAEAITRLGRAMRYDVVRVVEDDERSEVESVALAEGAQVATLEALQTRVTGALADEGECAVIVASQGHYDEPALAAILSSNAQYVGLVASHKRGDAVRAALAAAGVSNLERLRYPAGLDLGGRGPEEVALSIIGEIVQRLAKAGAARTPASSSAPAASGAAGTAIDPVCHMAVNIARARHVTELHGATYYFCCDGCRTRFLEDPQRYLAPTP
jgi:xanthine dehydrogenase accessory factor